jgi:hypothetical protein
MRFITRLSVLVTIVVAAAVGSPVATDAFPSFSLTPGSPTAGLLTPGAILDPATGAPTPAGPQPPPVIGLVAGALGLPPGGNLDGLSFGDDAILAAGVGAGPLSLQFSVAAGSVGGPWLPAVPAQNVFTQGVAGEGSAAGDIFLAGPPVLPPPFGPLACGLGGNAQLFDADGINAVAPAPPGLGGLLDPPPPPPGAPWDDIDAYEYLDVAAVDYQTMLAAPLSGADGRADGPIFFTVDPATAAGMGVSPADILVNDVASPTGWSLYAPAGALGLVPADDVDALLVGDSATIGAGLGTAVPPGRSYGPHPTDVVAFSLAPGSPSLAPAAPLPPVCAPGVKTPGDVWAVSPFLGGAPFPVFSAEGIGICSVRVAACAGVNDNLDAIDIQWGGDGDADGAPDALEAGCGAVIGPNDSDLDGLTDSVEMTLGTNPGGVCSAPTLAGLPDSDLDGMIDSWEIAYWTPACAATDPSTPDGPADFDGDGVPNIGEYTQFTSPCNVDSDGDGFADLPTGAHTGPANTAVGSDNCPNVFNVPQTNSDGNFTDLSPPKAFDDLTLAMSDAPGDACDTDDDNDTLTDVAEASGASCAGFITTSTNPDTDGDHFIDGAECSIGTNPTDITAKPGLAACGAAGDADGDGVLTQREFCFFATSPVAANSDLDACTDGREVASINGDTAVNVIDLSQVALEVGLYVLPGTAVQRNYDMNKDAAINVLDLSFVATRTGLCP